jgi:hypothetical protein
MQHTRKAELALSAKCISLNVQGMLIGVTVFAYIMSTVSMLLSTLNAQKLRLQQQQHQLDSFCNAYKLPSILSQKLKQYYDCIGSKQVHESDLQLLDGLSPTLRQQVLKC